MKLLKQLGAYTVILGIYAVAAVIALPVVLFIALTEPKKGEL